MNDIEALEANLKAARSEESRLWSEHRYATEATRKAEKALKQAKAAASNAASPSAVSAALKKAGFTRSVKSSTSVRGWNNHSNVYRVQGVDTETYVSHVWGVHYHPVGWREKLITTLTQYRKALETAGFIVAVRDGGESLSVTKAATND